MCILPGTGRIKPAIAIGLCLITIATNLWIASVARPRTLTSESGWECSLASGALWIAFWDTSPVETAFAVQHMWETHTCPTPDQTVVWIPRYAVLAEVGLFAVRLPVWIVAISTLPLLGPSVRRKLEAIPKPITFALSLSCIAHYFEELRG